jgi:phosphoribosylformimino-5-aminoimidazole carboxamide ribotide isomerase
MESFKVIPAIDLMDGRCVRLIRGRFEDKTIYNRAPIDLTKSFLDYGLDRVHVVDLDAVKTGAPVNLVTVEAIVSTGIKVEYGGGLRTVEDLRQVVNCGVKNLILGSNLLAEETILSDWTSRFPNMLIAGIDALDGKVAVHGWQSVTNVDAEVLVKKIESLGFSQIIYTDILRDGTLNGPNLSQLEKIVNNTTLPVIASGGVSCIQDIDSVKKLHSSGVIGVIVGKALYEGKLSLKEMSQC